MSNYTISVIIPTYNRYDAVHNAVKSVIRQTWPDIEIIVIDDGSCDPRTPQLPASLRQLIEGTSRSIQVIMLPENLRKKYNQRGGDPPCQGLVRNKGIDVATGTWIAFLDDDDEWSDPTKLEKQMNVMHKNAIPFSITNMTYEGGTLHHKKPLPEILKHRDIQCGNPIPLSTVIVRKDILVNAGLFRHVHAEDWDCWQRIMQYTDCVYLDVPMVRYSTSSPKYYNLHMFNTIWHMN